MPDQSGLQRAAMFLAMWTVMMVAMMLPFNVAAGARGSHRGRSWRAPDASAGLLRLRPPELRIFRCLALMQRVIVAARGADFHLGDGIVQLAIDEKATPEQRAAMLAICSGKEGGNDLRDLRVASSRRCWHPIYAAIEFQTDQDRRVATPERAGPRGVPR